MSDISNLPGTNIAIESTHCCECQAEERQIDGYAVLIEAATTLVCHYDETGTADSLVKDARRYLSQQFTSASLPKGL